MDVRELRKKVEYMCRSPKLKDEALEKIFKELEEVKEKNREFYLRAMSRLLVKKGRTSSAKTYVNDLFQEPSEVPVDYYNSYKINIAEENYRDAYLDLFKYKELLPESDISLPITMLEQIIDIDNNPNLYLKTDYTVKKTDKLLGFEFNKVSFLPKYHKIIDLFNKREYTKMIHELERLRMTTKNEPHLIETQSLLELTRVLERKQEEVKDRREEEKEEEPLTPQQEEILDEKIQRMKEMHEETKLVLIQYTIKSDYKIAKELLKELEDEAPTLYDVEVAYLKNCIREKELEENLPEERKEAYNKALAEGIKCLHYDDYETAYDYFLYGKYVTNHPVFDYYIGYCFFKTYHDEEAYQILSNYKEQGGEKLLETLTLLKSLDCKTSRLEQAKEKELEQARIVQTYKLNYNYLTVHKNKVKKLTTQA